MLHITLSLSHDDIWQICFRFWGIVVSVSHCSDITWAWCLKSLLTWHTVQQDRNKSRDTISNDAPVHYWFHMNSAEAVKVQYLPTNGRLSIVASVKSNMGIFWGRLVNVYLCLDNQFKMFKCYLHFCSPQWCLMEDIENPLARNLSAYIRIMVCLRNKSPFCKYICIYIYIYIYIYV